MTRNPHHNAALALVALLLAGCADPAPVVALHDPADTMFMDLVSIAGRSTLPTQGDTTLLIKAMDQIKTGDDACAKWKLDQILTIGMPLVSEAMTADAAGLRQIKVEARRKLREASAIAAPDELCHGHGFPPAEFG
jgi:type IV pilus biogenesis protein CpaD/CtpE